MVMESPTARPWADEVVIVATFDFRPIFVSDTGGGWPHAGTPRAGVGVEANGSLTTGWPTSGHPGDGGVVEFAFTSPQVTPAIVTVLPSCVSQPPTTRIAGAEMLPPGPKMSNASWLVSPWETSPLHESLYIGCVTFRWPLDLISSVWCSQVEFPPSARNVNGGGLTFTWAVSLRVTKDPGVAGFGFLPIEVIVQILVAGSYAPLHVTVPPERLDTAGESAVGSVADCPPCSRTETALLTPASASAYALWL